MCSTIPRSLVELQEYARFHYEGLQNAALFLAGPFALKRVQSLLDDILSSRTITRRLQGGIVDIHKLLSLYHALDPDRIEAAYFAEIDFCPPSPSRYNVKISRTSSASLGSTASFFFTFFPRIPATAAT